MACTEYEQTIYPSCARMLSEVVEHQHAVAWGRLYTAIFVLVALLILDILIQLFPPTLNTRLRKGLNPHDQYSARGRYGSTKITDRGRDS